MKLEKYFMDGKGNHSSSRLMAWHFMWYFFIFNTFFAFMVIWMWEKLSASGGEINLIMYIMGIDLLLLIAIFAPKQFNKVSEVREVIGVANAENKIEKKE
jgi:hypothetical protein